MLLSATLGIILIAAWSATLFGLLAPIWPVAQFGNHFRPYILAGCLVLAVAAGALGQRAGALIALAAAVLSGALMGATILLAPAAGASEASGDPIKVLSFNVWVANRHPEDVVALLRDEAADIVFLQELDDRLARAILPGLAELYPHILSCAAAANCRLALLSREPWLEAEHQGAEGDKPRHLRARYGESLGGLQIAGTHLAPPNHVELQARNADWITDYAANLQGPTIMLGDFNLTPWSWRLLHFTRATGLRRVGTWRNSWPAPGIVMGWPFSLFRIDHVFLSAGIVLHTWHIGRTAASDHLPVLVKLSVDRSAGAQVLTK